MSLTIEATIAKHAAPIREHRQLLSDGIAHLTYHSPNPATGELVSFTWNMDPSVPIEVSPGGYGEPVTHLIPVRARETALSARALATWFEWTCDEFLVNVGLDVSHEAATRTQPA